MTWKQYLPYEINLGFRKVFGFVELLSWVILNGNAQSVSNNPRGENVDVLYYRIFILLKKVTNKQQWLGDNKTTQNVLKLLTILNRRDTADYYQEKQ